MSGFSIIFALWSRPSSLAEIEDVLCSILSFANKEGQNERSVAVSFDPNTMKVFFLIIVEQQSIITPSS